MKIYFEDRATKISFIIGTFAILSGIFGNNYMYYKLEKDMNNLRKIHPTTESIKNIKTEISYNLSPQMEEFIYLTINKKIDPIKVMGEMARQKGLVEVIKE